MVDEEFFNESIWKQKFLVHEHRIVYCQNKIPYVMLLLKKVLFDTITSKFGSGTKDLRFHHYKLGIV